MQIFGDNKFVTGIKYEKKQGEKEPLILSDDDPRAVQILDGAPFTYDGETLTIVDVDDNVFDNKEIKKKKDKKEIILDMLEGKAKSEDVQRLLGVLLAEKYGIEIPVPDVPEHR